MREVRKGKKGEGKRGNSVKKKLQRLLPERYAIC